MTTLETLIGNLPFAGTWLARVADQLNAWHLPEASATSVSAALLALLVAAVTVRLIRARRLAGSGTVLTSRLDTLAERVTATELLLADAAAEISALRQRLSDLSSRHEAANTSKARSSLRQAIALSRHGATQRQLIDTCGLSQGEAHLIQNLYGQTGAPDPVPELH